VILLLGCAPLHDELVIPWDIETTVLEGPLGFGKALAVSRGRVAIADNESVCIHGGRCVDEPDVLAIGLGGTTLGIVSTRDYRTYHGAEQADWDGTHPFFGQPARSGSAADGAWAAAFDDRVWINGDEFHVEDPRFVDAQSRTYVHCPSETCEVVSSFSGAVAGETTAQGVSGVWDGELYVSDPEDAGSVRGPIIESGPVLLEGIEGDHLGRSIGGGYAAGVYNQRTAPGRLRLVSLDGGPTLAIDRVPVNRPVVLAGDDQVLAIGLPFGPDHGRVYLVDRDDL